MNIKNKRELLAYLTDHNDGSENAMDLIRMMELECNWADSNLGVVTIDDLDILGDEIADILRTKLGKEPGSKWTVDDCQVVANEIYNNEDEFGFGNWINFAIRAMEPEDDDGSGYSNHTPGLSLFTLNKQSRI